MEEQKITDPEQVASLLRQWAVDQRLLQATEKELEAGVSKLQAVLKETRKKLSDGEEFVRSSILTYILETGDTHVHPSVTFVRTHTLVYDKDEITKVLQERKAGDLLRVTVALDVRAFEAAYKRGEQTDLQVEEVNAPTLRIGPLGDLLLGSEITPSAP